MHRAASSGGAQQLFNRGVLMARGHGSSSGEQQLFMGGGPPQLGEGGVVVVNNNADPVGLCAPRGQ